MRDGASDEANDSLGAVVGVRSRLMKVRAIVRKAAAVVSTVREFEVGRHQWRSTHA
jgi:hypothetical protein